MNASNAVTLDRRPGGVTILTLNRPTVLNAIDFEMAGQLATTLADLTNDDQTSVLVITGAGRGFCSGADLQALAAGLPNWPSKLDMMHYVTRPMRELNRLPHLTIAAVNGPAIGAGWGLAMGCDIRIAGPTARFGATFIRLGLGPDYGLSQSLPRTIGRERAIELLATGRLIDAEEAHRIGVFSTRSEDPLCAAITLADTIAAAPLRAIRSIKSTLDRATHATFADVITNIEANAQAALFDHPHFESDSAAWFAYHTPDH
ncbi:enoyl-CoA hydratase/isomerase family protein [Nocardia sp. NPDC059240]|uniref:enoyl-CoA hydratase/isomerase family protein n=1 Tax=Nocardia sp. NPDC059240 TaxID=3346786 RepID=UPI0036BE79CD